MLIVECAACGNDFDAKRKTARYCSPACQKRGVRKEAAGSSTPAEEIEHGARFLASTIAEVERLGKAATVAGRQVVVIAERIASPFSTGSEVASLSKEHSRLMDELGRGAAQADPVDEMKARREQKASKASG